MAQTLENAALLSPCHIQNSRRRCGFFRQTEPKLPERKISSAVVDGADVVLDLFL
jgi:hypothetical protein